MSANFTGHGGNVTNDWFFFNNTIRMPSYLMSIAVGNLSFGYVDHRTEVITEPCKIDATKWELANLGKFLNYTEEYLTPYIWGTYAILILPPSFPMGGMENPLLTCFTNNHYWRQISSRCCYSRNCSLLDWE